MQALDGEIEMDWRRPWFWPFRKFLISRGEKVPAYIPQANQFAKKFAEVAGGTAMSTLPEILFDVPGTAHCIGGCVIADSATSGVVDRQQRVFGYQNMYICDGSVIAANLGVNPSLTITALAERAMRLVPARSEKNYSDDQSEPLTPRSGEVAR
jgi:cholesterol oxidase